MMIVVMCVPSRIPPLSLTPPLSIFDRNHPCVCHQGENSEAVRWYPHEPGFYNDEEANAAFGGGGFG